MIEHLREKDFLICFSEAFGCSLEEARDYLRPEVSLESAALRTRQYEHYGTTDIAYLAAVLAHSIAGMHLFHDGNKRTALVALDTFLAHNGLQVTASEEELRDWMIYLSQPGSGDEHIQNVADWMRDLLTPSDEDIP